MKFVKNQFGYLFSGLVIWLPMVIIIAVLVVVFSKLEEIGKSVLNLFLPAQFVYPGFGIILGIIVLYLTGVILKKTVVGDFLSRVPILGIFFRKGEGKMITLDRLFNLTPCLFLFSPTCPSYGWILSEEKVKLNKEKASFTLINVYYPNVPTLVTGQIFPIRRGAVIKLGNPSKEVIDLLLYGLRSPENLQYLPWEDENKEKFKKRAELFGLRLSTD